MDDEQDVKIEAEVGDRERSERVEDPEAIEEMAEGKVKKLREEIENLRKEKQEYLDGWQRAKADYVNALKRFEQDVRDARAGGVVKAVEAFLPAYDALERAKEHGELPEGFVGIGKQIEAAFKMLGVEAIGVVGEKFDPSLHEAFGQEPTESQEQDDTVTVVLEKGYRMNGAIICPAKVKVAHFG